MRQRFYLFIQCKRQQSQAKISFRIWSEKKNDILQGVQNYCKTRVTHFPSLLYPNIQYIFFIVYLHFVLYDAVCKELSHFESFSSFFVHFQYFVMHLEKFFIYPNSHFVSHHIAKGPKRRLLNGCLHQIRKTITKTKFT